ncbi:MAG: lysine--tRNA ligase [Clostridiales bacterium]|jgi:lysyl-tRNA synthetase class 2|nr:lysine--tRNA ligase [Clostridiales bacterium]
MDEDISELLKIKRQKLSDLREEGEDPFLRVKYDVTRHSAEIRESFDALEGEVVSIAGRVMTRRLMGKASFCDVQDGEGRIQAYVRSDDVSPEAYARFKRFDIGDIIGVKGLVFKTHKGEISVKASEITLLAKSLRVLPEKFHGLKDQETRYRMRYLDLIVNPEVKNTFIKRSRIIKCVRDFLDERGFLEVETPVLQTNPGGAAARPFATRHNALGIDMYMRIALELHLKRLIIGGMERVYEIGRVFRNEGVSVKHNPEFTLLELYQAYTDYYGMMELTENLIRYVCTEAIGSFSIPCGDVEIDFSKPFEVISMADAVKKHTGVDFNSISEDEAKKIAAESGVICEPRHKKGDALNLFFEKHVEEKLIQPTFLIDHPVEISPLTKRKPTNPNYVERFELYICGREYANAYSELNDPIDQRARFEYQESLRAQGDDEANRIDEDFIAALEYGMPPTGGMGMGIDRLVTLLTNSFSIRDALLFPTMRPVE